MVAEGGLGQGANGPQELRWIGYGNSLSPVGKNDVLEHEAAKAGMMEGVVPPQRSAAKAAHDVGSVMLKDRGEFAEVVQDGEKEQQRVEVPWRHGGDKGLESIMEGRIRIKDALQHRAHVEGVVDEQVIGRIGFRGLAPISVHGVFRVLLVRGGCPCCSSFSVAGVVAPLNLGDARMVAGRGGLLGRQGLGSPGVGE